MEKEISELPSNNDSNISLSVEESLANQQEILMTYEERLSHSLAQLQTACHQQQMTTINEILLRDEFTQNGLRLMDNVVFAYALLHEDYDLLQELFRDYGTYRALPSQNWLFKPWCYVTDMGWRKVTREFGDVCRAFRQCYPSSDSFQFNFCGSGLHASTPHDADVVVSETYLYDPEEEQMHPIDKLDACSDIEKHTLDSISPIALWMFKTDLTRIFRGLRLIIKRDFHFSTTCLDAIKQLANEKSCNIFLGMNYDQLCHQMNILLGLDPELFQKSIELLRNWELFDKIKQAVEQGSSKIKETMEIKQKFLSRFPNTSILLESNPHRFQYAGSHAVIEHRPGNVYQPTSLM